MIFSSRFFSWIVKLFWIKLQRTIIILQKKTFKVSKKDLCFSLKRVNQSEMINL